MKYIYDRIGDQSPLVSGEPNCVTLNEARKITAHQCGSEDRTARSQRKPNKFSALGVDNKGALVPFLPTNELFVEPKRSTTCSTRCKFQLVINLDELVEVDSWRRK